MDPWLIITKRWPKLALNIRLHCATDPEFRELIADYAEARHALDFWTGIDPPSSRRIADYGHLIRELECEIEGRIAE